MSSLRPWSTTSTAGPFTRGLLVAAAGLSLVTAQSVDPADFEDNPEGEESEGILSGGLLPNGSILKDVVIPSYDKDLKLTSNLRAAELTIYTREESQFDTKTGKEKTVTVLNKIRTTQLRIEFFNPDETLRARIDLKDSLFRASKNLLSTSQPVSLVADDLVVDGAGLSFDAKNNRGFLFGPVKAVATTRDTRTSMNTIPARKAIAAGALLMAATLPAQEKPPTTAERFADLRLSPAELEELTAEAATRRPTLKAAGAEAKAEMEKINTQSNDARITMNSFLQAAALASLMAEPAPAAVKDVPRPEVTSERSETTITSKDGAYFDATEGLLIFLKDVRVKNPQFQLTGADEVKAFMVPQEKSVDNAAKPGKSTALAPPVMEKKPQPEVEVPKPEAKAPKEITPEMAEKMRAAKEAGGKGEFGDVKRIVATGTVVIDFTPDDPTKSPMKASARTMIYDMKNEMVILRGGSPWVVQDGKPTIVKGDDAYIFIYMKDGDPVRFVTGNQEMFETTFKTEKKDEQPKNR